MHLILFKLSFASYSTLRRDKTCFINYEIKIMSVSNTDIGAYEKSPSVPSQKGSKKTVQYGKLNLGY